MARRTTPSRRSLVSLLVVGMLCILAISAVPRASADGDIGITVNVDVLGTSDSPTPSVTATATSSASTTPGGETSIGGVLFISGLTMRYTPSINPLDGRVDMSFTVRNAYKKALDGKATFWVTAWFGNRVGHQVEVSVPAIAPDETRLVTATIRGVGQWGILTGHVTFVPPPSLDSVTLTAVTRTGTILYIPWFPVVCLAGGTAFWFAVRRRAAWYEIFAAIGGRR
jgi:hypothetical protein